jgi:glyoxylase-like metal-dependent hydrolase (beta-lactamase superfamily II)
MTETANLVETHIETLFSEDISAATYYIESGTECVLVDPSLVLTDKIKTILQNRAKTLKYILLTHIPSSYISGYLEYDNVEVIVGPGVQGN